MANRFTDWVTTCALQTLSCYCSTPAKNWMQSAVLSIQPEARMSDKPLQAADLEASRAPPIRHTNFVRKYAVAKAKQNPRKWRRIEPNTSTKRVHGTIDGFHANSIRLQPVNGGRSSTC